MNSIIKSLLFVTLMALPVQASKKKEVTTPLSEITLGQPTAPVLLIDYSSLTCGHCADFYLQVLPEVYKKYIQPGHMRVVFRDFPGDQVALKAHQIAWCKGEIKYLDFVKLLYSLQEKWLTAPDPIAALKAIMTQNGVSSTQFEAALKNQNLLDKLVQVRLEGQKKYSIDATPTIIINAKIYKKALTLQEIDDILRPILADKKEKEDPQKDKL